MSRALAPRLWWGHVLVLVAVVAAGFLGWWQVDSWQERRAAEAQDLSRITPVPLTDLIGPDDAFPGREVGHPVTFSGTWVPSGTVYVSGREHDGTDGYWVVTPLAVDGSGGSAMPVVLGWTATVDAAPAPPTGTADLTAYLQPSEGTGQVDDDPSDDLLPQLRIADLIQHVDQDLYGAYAVSQTGLDGLTTADLAQLPQASTFTALRNLLYGIEWWFFGAFAVFIWWRWVRDETRDPAESIPEEPVPTGSVS